MAAGVWMAPPNKLLATLRLYIYMIYFLHCIDVFAEGLPCAPSAGPALLLPAPRALP